MKNSELLQAVKPGNHPKYSPNFHEWLTKLVGTWNDRYPVQVFERIPELGFDPGYLLVGIQYEDQIIGSRLMHILATGKRAEQYSFDARDYEEVPSFVGRYVAIGRCAIDPEHKQNFIGDESRWVYVDGSTRLCQWCCDFHMTMKRVKVTKIVEEWARVTL